jgi:ABC-type lipoprotein export system ATPase subunit
MEAGKAHSSVAHRIRVAPARVLAQRAPLLMPDEPTAALDLRHQVLVLRVCRERARAGDAVVVVLHDLGARGGVRGPGGDPARRADRGGRAAGRGVRG